MNKVTSRRANGQLTSDNNVGARIQALIDNRQYHDACSIAESIGPFVGFRDEVREIIWRFSNLCLDLAYKTITDEGFDSSAGSIMSDLRKKFDGFRSNTVPVAVSDALIDIFPVRNGNEVSNQETVDKLKYEEDLEFVRNMLATVTRKYLGTRIKQPKNFDGIAKSILGMMILDGSNMTHGEFYNAFNKYLEKYFDKSTI